MSIFFLPGPTHDILYYSALTQLFLISSTLLQNILTLPSAPSSPSTLSTLASVSIDNEVLSTTSTPVQIITAHILLTLLSPPPLSSSTTKHTHAHAHALPLQALKETVSHRLHDSPRSGVSEKDVTRALYSAIAKKLLVIDRGGGGQVVRFSSG